MTYHTEDVDGLRLKLLVGELGKMWTPCCVSDEKWEFVRRKNLLVFEKELILVNIATFKEIIGKYMFFLEWKVLLLMEGNLIQLIFEDCEKTKKLLDLSEGKCYLKCNICSVLP